MHSNNTNHEKIRRIVLTGLFAAFITVATLASFPLPGKGYANLGDAFIIVTSLLLPAGYGFLAAGIGSALADLILGYAVFAPGPFVIKGLMALAVYFIASKRKNLLFVILGAIVAELIMIGGYLLYGGALFGFAGALEDLLGNVVQGAIGIVLGVTAHTVLEKTGIAGAIRKDK